MTRICVFFAFALLFLQFEALADDVAKPMTPVDMLSVPTVSDGHLSPDGLTLAFVRSVVDWKQDSKQTDLCIQRIGEQKLTQLTHGRRGVSHPRWSPDGRCLAFLAKPEDERREQIHILPLSGGDAYQLTDHSKSVRSIRWSPDGDTIYFRAVEDRSPLGDDDGPLNTLLIPFDSRPNKLLWKVDVASKKPTQLTSAEINVRSYDVSRDGKMLLVEYSSTALIDNRHEHSGVMLLNSDGKEKEDLASGKHEYIAPKLSPDGTQLLFLADVNEAGEVYYNTNLFIIDISQRSSPKLLIPDFDGEVLSAVWSADSNSIFFSANLGVHSELFELKLPSQELTQLTDGKHGIRGFTFARAANRFAIQFYSTTNSGDYWTFELTKELKPLTDVGSSYLDDFALPQQRAIHWKAQDGQALEGLVTLPLGFEEGNRYPLVVQTHGGPRSSDQYGRWRWKGYRAVLGGHGYAVLTVNHRGGTGYGDAFMRDMMGDYFRNAHNDVLSGVDHVIEVGIADPDRMAVMGWSAGGHMTNKLITVTDRFKVASSGAGAVDWVSMYGESDTRHLRTPWFGGSPWQQDAPLDAFREQSALKDMWRVKTPTLIFVGEDDERVPATQSILMARALTANGVKNELYIAPGFGHDWPAPSYRLFKTNKELEWFERYLCDREYEWQEVPIDD